MANKRMFSLKIVDTDAFADMPVASQLLYFHLAMRADDDGFIGSPKRVMRGIGLEEKDYTVLCDKRFILTFESGVCVIKHWFINNNKIQGDRYSGTKYIDEKSLVIVKENGAYTECKQNVNTGVNGLDTQSRVEESRVEKNRVEITLASKLASATKETKKPTHKKVASKPKKEKKAPKPKKVKAPIVEYTPEKLEEVLTKMESTPHLDLIATYIREKPVKIENSQQLNLVITRFCKVASDMVGAYTNAQIFKAIDDIKKDNKWKERKGEPVVDWTIETILKKLVKN